MGKHINEVGLPGSELTARIALAAAGLSGNRHIGETIHRIGSAALVVAHVHDKISDGLPDEITDRVRLCATPEVVAHALEHTRINRMGILTPDDREWPAQLSALGNAEPLLLWLAGDTGNLSELPVAMTGTTRPTNQGREDVVELATRLADAQWVIAATSRPGIDQLALLSAEAVGGRSIVVVPTARLPRSTGHELAVSENPPGAPIMIGGAMRTHALLAALAGKIIVTEAQAGSGAMRTGIAGHALGRPVGVTEDAASGSRRLRREYGAPLVRTLAEVERLH